MTISGGVKFFKRSKNFASDGATATASSGTSSAKLMLDRNAYTTYRSVGSNDLDTVEIVITIPFTITIDRLFIINHNLLEFTVEYDLGGVWTSFSNVEGVEGPGVGISETSNSLTTNYYEFDSISTTSFRILATKTLVANQEKFITFFTTTEELGTLGGFPEIKNVTKDRNARKKEVLNGRLFVQKSIEVKKFNLDFKGYPSKLTSDLALMEFLYDLDAAFNIWICGGRNGAPYFGYQLKGFRLEDLVQVQITNNFRDSYPSNFYNGGVNMKVVFEEST